MFGWYLFGVIVVFSQQKSLVARDDYPQVVDKETLVLRYLFITEDISHKLQSN